MTKQKKRVLIYDDDEGILDVTKIVLTQKGYDVVGFSDCTNIIQKIQEYSPDVLLLDLWMPHMSGEEVTKKLKSSKKTKKIPVIIISANKDTKLIANNIGADGFINKPFDIEYLENIVEKFA